MTRFVTVASEREQRMLIDLLNTNRYITAEPWSGGGAEGGQIQVKITS